MEHRDRQATRIGGRLQHQRRYGGDQDCLGHALRAVASDIAGNFATARGVTDMDGALEIELLDEFSEVVGVVAHVVAGPRLARTPVAAALMRNSAISMVTDIEHLLF